MGVQSANQTSIQYACPPFRSLISQEQFKRHGYHVLRGVGNIFPCPSFFTAAHPQGITSLMLWTTGHHIGTFTESRPLQMCPITAGFCSAVHECCSALLRSRWSCTRLLASYGSFW